MDSKLICPGCSGAVELRSALEPNDCGWCESCGILWDRDDLAPAEDIEYVREAIYKTSKKMTGSDPRDN